ncbi:DUF6684 family protein [Haloferax namakaokahaiae]|uniref:DUF6684 family protein n=1 Tax=Haloferax namakaokahaiae TaxID=1748331 RepID=A0ABD5ZGB7_9EURY
MANKTFDKDTMLDLVVNMVPLAIILFFVVAFAVVNPFGFESLPSGLQFALLIVPFVALAVLTYLSGKAIAGAEKTGTVYPPGAATVPGIEPLHEEESELEEPKDESASAVEGDTA